MGDVAYQLKTMEMGVILLDGALRITALSGSAADLLGQPATALDGQPLLDLHPPAARAKVAFLLDQARSQTPHAGSMTIALPGRLLHVRVCPMAEAPDPQAGAGGLAVILHAVDPDAGASPPVPGHVEGPLPKLPVETGGVTLFLDPATVVHIEADGHYSRVHDLETSHFCALSIAELERRLDPSRFLRPHRSHLVNLTHVRAFRKAERGGHLIMAGSEGGGDHSVPVSRNRVALLRERLAV